MKNNRLTSEQPDYHHIRRGAGEWKKQGRNTLRLLALILAERCISRQQQKRYLYGYDAMNNTFIQCKRRLGQVISTMTGVRTNQVFIQESEDDPLRIHSDVPPIYGCVERNMLESIRI